MLGQTNDSEIAEVQPGRFERLNEIRGQTDGDAVACPGFGAVPDLEMYSSGVQRFGMRSVKSTNLALSVFFADKGARMHITQCLPGL